MADTSPFPPQELEGRLAKVRASMAERNLDGLLIASPENIYYLTGLDHWGFFATHILAVSPDGRMILIARAMEGITVANQVHNADFYGHADHEEVSDYVLQAMNDLGYRDGRVALEEQCLFLTPRNASLIKQGAPQAEWHDGSDLVDEVRLVKSPLEMDYTRLAAKASDAGMLAAIEAIGDGATDYEVAGECQRAMCLAGSEYPGFGPFVRPTSRLGEEHTTWRGETFRNGDAVFLELGASYRKYQAPMGRLVYVGSAPSGVDRTVEMAIEAMAAIAAAIVPGGKAGDAYAAWREVARAGGLTDYERHHCGYLVGIGFPPSWTGGSMVTGLAPNSELKMQIGMSYHLHSWFTDTDCVDYFISNTGMLTENGCEILTSLTPESLQLRT
ncbi:MAG: aminopeptidase P family protein [Rhodobacteraceae bacterium]|nr:aminopeptidase P family protein [Paracoccaceae bacterium]